MPKIDKALFGGMLLAAGMWTNGIAAAVRLDEQVQAGGGPLASSTITLWAAGAGEPKQVAQTKSAGDGRFQFHRGSTWNGC